MISRRMEMAAGWAMRPALPLVGAAVAITLVTSYLFARADYASLVYLVIIGFSLLAAFAPIRYGVAALLLFSGIAGFLKLLTDYAPVAHLGNDIVLGCLLLGHLARAATGGARLYPEKMPFRLPLAVLLLGAVALSFAPYTTYTLALGGWKSYVEPVLLVPIVAVGMAKPGSLRPTLVALAAAGLANCAAFLYEISVGPQAVSGWGPGFGATVGSSTIIYDGAGHIAWRAFGLAQDPGAAAVLIAVGAVVLLRYAIQAARLPARLAAIAGSSFCVFGVYETGVRTAVVGMVAGLLVAALLTRSRRISAVALAAGAIALLGTLSYLVGGGGSPVQVSRLAGLANPHTYLVQRGGVWSLIVPTLIHSPLGVGMGRAIPASALLSQLSGGQGDYSGVANENMLLGMEVELGVFGAVFVLATWYEVGRDLWRRLRARLASNEIDACLALLATLFAVGLSGSIFVSEPASILLWASAAALSVRVRQAVGGAS